VTVNWRATYAGFADLNIPGMQDLNVLTTNRRKGIASRLLDRAEAEVTRRSPLRSLTFAGVLSAGLTEPEESQLYA